MVNLPYKELKKIYGVMIDSLLSKEGLTIPVTLIYLNNQPEYCNNCIYDPVSKKSSSLYNNTGPNIFPENSICPVCLGMGYISSKSTETVHMAVLFDSKYWTNIDNKIINTSDNLVQTICKETLLPKLLNAREIYFNNNSTKRYIRLNHTRFAGLGNSDYIFMMWENK
jgi:hypothetical protein